MSLPNLHINIESPYKVCFEGKLTKQIRYKVKRYLNLCKKNYPSIDKTLNMATGLKHSNILEHRVSQQCRLGLHSLPDLYRVIWFQMSGLADFSSLISLFGLLPYMWEDVGQIYFCSCF